jgi:membrane complex biogenesis BtpA family protein
MLAETFQKPKPILGTVALLPLPGASGWNGHWEGLITRAEQEATALATSGVDGLILQNTHDAPFSQERMDPAGAIAMAMLARRIRQFTRLPVGVSVLPNDPETALAIAMNTEAEFIRLPLLSGALVTDGGVLNSRLNHLLQTRNRLHAHLPPLLVDISVNHLAPAASLRNAHEAGPQTGQLHLEHLIHLAKASLQADLDITVVLSDRDIEAADLVAFKDSTGCEVLVENSTGALVAEAYFDQADGLILEGDVRKSAASQPGTWPSIDMTRAEELVNKLRKVVPVGEMDPNIFLQRG